MWSEWAVGSELESGQWKWDIKHTAALFNSYKLITWSNHRIT